MNGEIVLVPEYRYGRGSGHLLRVLELASRLTRDGSAAPSEAVVLLHTTSEPDSVAEAIARLAANAHIPVEFAGPAERSESGASGDWQSARGPRRQPLVVCDPAVVRAARLVVLDCRELSMAELRGLGLEDSSALVVGLDLGGEARAYCDYLIDTLPRVDAACEPNLADTGLLRFPLRSRAQAPLCFRRVLLSFGGEDAAGLTGLAAEALRTLREETAAGTGENGLVVYATRGALFRRDLPAGVRLFTPAGSLRDELWQFDLVITTFGLTAFEAAAAGCGVALVSPSRYHARLARRAGFPELGVRPTARALARRLRSVFSGAEQVVRRTRAALPAEPRDLASVLRELDPQQAIACPVCSERSAPSVTRTSGRTYLRCPRCGMVYLRRVCERGIAYDEQYFFEQYRRQYGRTYLEDFWAIKATGRERGARIRQLLSAGLRRATGSGRPALLDIGMAYGPFLDAARETGFEPFGIDVSRSAVEFVQSRLGIPAACCSVEAFSPSAAFGREQFEAVTMWYVIEHLTDLEATLSRVNAMLPEGGVFAFSTPNGAGISARRNYRGFLADGPADHFTIWEPNGCRRVLQRFGFRVARVVVTGHHPERFPGVGAQSRAGIRYRLAGLLSRALRLGDTFELYAVKERACTRS